MLQNFPPRGNKLEGGKKNFLRKHTRDYSSLHTTMLTAFE
jgi:hypothetical protein